MRRARHTTQDVEPLCILSNGLSPDEDDELRRLNFLATVGQLSDSRQERLVELRLRDRRDDVREPRESLVVKENEEDGGKRQFRFERTSETPPDASSQ